MWDAVGRRLADHDVDSDSSAMADLYDAKRGDLAALAGAVAPVDGQIGAVAEIAGRPVALDLVSRADVFAALLPRLAQGYALDALGIDAEDANPRAAEGFLHSALEAPRREIDTPGLGRGLVISTTGIEGAGLEHDPELIQLSAFPAGERGPDPQPPVVEAGTSDHPPVASSAAQLGRRGHVVDGINGAFDRIDDFLSVQSRAPSVEAVTRLQEAVGIDDDERAAIRERLEAIGQREHAGGVLLGVILGLLAAEHAAD